MRTGPSPTTALLLALLLARAGGCAPRILQAPPGRATDTQTVVLCRNMEWAEPLWRREAGRRYPGALVLMVHGGDDRGVWTAYPDQGPAVPVEAAARLLRAEHPGRPIVLVICNEGHHALAVPGVAYATDTIWLRPDRDCWPFFPARRFGVGSIEQFHRAP